ncbi:hypothetical protein MMC30_002724 [Trapelia coarctata]|nr:hypothetical protein [Trapelia coarctata]
MIPDLIPSLDPKLTPPADQHPHFQLAGTTRDILIPAAFRSGNCLVLVNEAMPLPEGWTISSPKLASTKYTLMWPIARKLAEEIMHKCPTTANGHETTSLGWALEESCIEDDKYFYKVLIREAPQIVRNVPRTYGDMLYVPGEFGGMYNLYKAAGPRLRPVLSSGQLGPPLQWSQKGLSSPRQRKNRNT